MQAHIVQHGCKLIRPQHVDQKHLDTVGEIALNSQYDHRYMQKLRYSAKVSEPKVIGLDTC